MKKSITLAIGLAVVALVPSTTHAQEMNFFLTSVGSGNGADRGGLEGADAHCQSLASAAGGGAFMWRAYLSAAPDGGAGPVHAKDRIGTGPFYNSAGVMVARDVAHLHSEDMGLGKEGSLNETGGLVNGRGDQPNTHDILTGSNMDGTLAMGDGDTTCANWTSSGDGAAMLGHHDRQGGGANPNSWNSAHASGGCSQQQLAGTGGAGLFYCFGLPGSSSASAAIGARPLSIR